MIGASPAETAAIRAEFDALVLPEVCTIRRRASPGGAWSDVATDVPCRLTPGAETTGMSDIASQLDATGVLRLPAGTDIGRLDRVRIGGEAGEVLADVVHVPPTVRVHHNVLVRAVESA